MNAREDQLLVKLWKYNDWANRSLFSQFGEDGFCVSADSLRLLSHIVNTQWAWLGRINAEKSVLGAWEIHELNRCVEIHQFSSEGLKAHLDQDSESTITYTNFQGVTYTNSIQDILIHVFNHGSYHRAQIARDLRENGLVPINTDYITFVRSSYS
ncbi:Uncharacterized damage-inducible protein DinB (forms a four-helix bundle) [bacterium A37T11]|nr:Uncharacterized damage-inducible protein DinB (forms a four-helix bundle) [bacterium A37T11]